MMQYQAHNFKESQILKNKKIKSPKETKIGNFIFGKTLLSNIEQTTSWRSEAIFLQSFKVLQGNAVEDIHLEFPDTKYKALQGSNP